jgi:hypothetical protein
MGIGRNYYLIFITIWFSFHVISGAKFRRHFIEKCVNLPTLSQIGSKGFSKLRPVDLIKASPTIVENCIQG